MTSIRRKRDNKLIIRHDYSNNYIMNNMSIQQCRLFVIKTNHYVTDETSLYFQN